MTPLERQAFLHDTPTHELFAALMERYRTADHVDRITIRALRWLRNAIIGELDKRYPALLD